MSVTQESHGWWDFRPSRKKALTFPKWLFMAAVPDPGTGEIKVIAAIMQNVVTALAEGMQREEVPRRRQFSHRFQARDPSGCPRGSSHGWASQ